MYRNPCILLLCLLTIISSVALGAGLCQAQLLPPPPALSESNYSAKLDDILSLQKQTLSVLRGVRDRIFLIEAEQRERKIREVNQE